MWGSSPHLPNAPGGPFVTSLGAVPIPQPPPVVEHGQQPQTGAQQGHHQQHRAGTWGAEGGAEGGQRGIWGQGGTGRALGRHCSPESSP